MSYVSSLSCILGILRTMNAASVSVSSNGKEAFPYLMSLRRTKTSKEKGTFLHVFFRSTQLPISVV